MENKTLETMGNSFYEFLASAANLISMLFSLIGVIVCIKTGTEIWRQVQREGYAPADQLMMGQLIGFAFGALLEVLSVVTYALSGRWG